MDIEKKRVMYWEQTIRKCVCIYMYIHINIQIHSIEAEVD